MRNASSSFVVSTASTSISLPDCFKTRSDYLLFLIGIPVYLYRPSLINKHFRVGNHCMKSVQTGSFFWSEYGKCGLEKTPYLDTFHELF